MADRARMELSELRMRMDDTSAEFARLKTQVRRGQGGWGADGVRGQDKGGQGEAGLLGMTGRGRCWGEGKGRRRGEEEC